MNFCFSGLLKKKTTIFIIAKITWQDTYHKDLSNHYNVDILPKKVKDYVKDKRECRKLAPARCCLSLTASSISPIDRPILYTIAYIVYLLGKP